MSSENFSILLGDNPIAGSGAYDGGGTADHSDFHFVKPLGLLQRRGANQILAMHFFTDLREKLLTEERLAHVRALNDIAAERGQSLAQLALAWALRDPQMTSLVVGASSVAQLDDNVGALTRLDFTDDELDEIDQCATDADINIWARSSSA